MTKPLTCFSPLWNPNSFVKCHGDGQAQFKAMTIAGGGRFTSATVSWRVSASSLLASDVRKGNPEQITRHDCRLRGLNSERGQLAPLQKIPISYSTESGIWC